MILEYISGPLIGAVIGYCTNYLAVKMLFYPKKEIRIGGHKLPFTPGAIPKGKPRLARAIGEIVGKTLLTEEDIAGQLLSGETEDKIVTAASDILSRDVKDEILLLTGAEEQTYGEMKDKLSAALGNGIKEALEDIRIGDVIAQESGKILSGKVQGTMLEMFLSQEMIASIAGPIGEEIQKFISKNGLTYIQPELDRKLMQIEEKSAAELLEKIDITKEKQNSMILSVYQKAVHAGVDNMTSELHISKIIEDKINAMDMDELENLVLTVMKKELDMIVNLGALIGFLLGLINLLF
ncbi:MAG: DUF445 family protein [Eubacteriales bacterium]|nr:DUF445 family protein [Eubacteriales bacterium]